MDVIFKNSGVFRISPIRDLDQEVVDKLMKAVEEYLSSKADYKPIMLPDGFVLCYERLKHKDKQCDVYYSPFKFQVKICYTDDYPEVEEKIIDLDRFDSSSIKVSHEDFNKIVKKCDDFSKIQKPTIEKDNPDTY